LVGLKDRLGDATALADLAAVLPRSLPNQVDLVFASRRARCKEHETENPDDGAPGSYQSS